MDQVYVAAIGDTKAEEALRVLQSRNLNVHLLDVEQGEVAPAGSIAFFTVEGYSYHFPGSHLRVTAHRFNGMAPDWTNNTPFQVALRGTTDPMKSKGFATAVEQVASGYSQWTVPTDDIESKEDIVRPPWGTIPTESGNLELYNGWIGRALQNWENSHNLASALLRHKMIRPQSPSQPFPKTDARVFTMLCPHFVEHGVLGGVETLNYNRIGEVAEIFKTLAVDAGGQLKTMEALIPTEELYQDPWYHIMPPNLWHDPDLRAKLKSAEEALRTALAKISEISGIEIVPRSFAECPHELYMQAVVDPVMEGMVEELIPDYITFQSDYSSYPEQDLREKIRWEQGLYLAVARWLPQDATVINMEVWTRQWEVAWGYATEYNPGINLWWPTTRQHFK